MNKNKLRFRQPEDVKAVTSCRTCRILSQHSGKPTFPIYHIPPPPTTKSIYLTTIKNTKWEIITSSKRLKGQFHEIIPFIPRSYTLNPHFYATVYRFYLPIFLLKTASVLNFTAFWFKRFTEHQAATRVIKSC
jgi:hypothetical protein